MRINVFYIAHATVYTNYNPQRHFGILWDSDEAY